MSKVAIKEESGLFVLNLQVLHKESWFCF